jgi:hypothetical protein
MIMTWQLYFSTFSNHLCMTDHYNNHNNMDLPEEDGPGAFEPVVKSNVSFGRVGREVRHNVS